MGIIVHQFPSGEVCFGPKSRVVHLWEVSELEFKNMSHMYCMRISQSDLWERTLGVQVKSGMYDGSHLERCVLVLTAELYTIGNYLNWNLKNISSPR